MTFNQELKQNAIKAARELELNLELLQTQKQFNSENDKLVDDIRIMTVTLQNHLEGVKVKWLQKWK